MKFTTRYCRLTFEERCQIQAFLESKISLAQMSRSMGRSRSTLWREINRNARYPYQYRSDIAHHRYLVRRAAIPKKFVVSDNIEGIVVHYLFERWSPEQIAGRIQKELGSSICKQSIYNFIHNRDQGLRPLLTRYLRRGGGRISQRRNSDGRYPLTIWDRPEGVINRRTFGHWERDGMQVANQKLFLVGVERKSRFTFFHLLKERTSLEINKITKTRMLKIGQRPTKTLTNDRGSEFSKSEEMGVPVYFCDPQKPQQRGTIENTIGRLRKYFPRSFDVKTTNTKEIINLNRKFNAIPRKTLNFRTPYEVYFNKTVALVI